MLKHCHTDTFEPSESERWTVPRIQERPPRHLLVTTVPTLGDALKSTTGWWLTYPSEEYEFASWDDDMPNYYGKNTSHVPVTTNQTINRWNFVAGHLLKWVIYGELVGASAVSSFTAYGTSNHLKSSQVIVSFPMKRPMEGWSPVIGGSQNVLPPALDLHSSWSSWFTTVKSMWNPYCPTVDALKKHEKTLMVKYQWYSQDIPWNHTVCCKKKILTKSPIISYQIPCFSMFFTIFHINQWLVGGAITILKNVRSSSMGKRWHQDDIPYIVENNPFMFETTNQMIINHD